MDRVLAVVLSEPVFHAVQRESRPPDTVAVAADGGAKVGSVVGDVLFNVVVPQHDVGGVTIPVGYYEGNQDAAIIGDLGFQSVCAREGEYVSWHR